MKQFQHAVLALAAISIVGGCGPSGTPALPFPAPPWKKAPPTAGPKPQPPGTIVWRSTRDPKDAEFKAAARLMSTGEVAETIRMLEENSELIKWEHQDGGGLLNNAANYGHITIVEYLLEHGANPHTRNSWGATPLYFCVIGSDYVGRDYVGVVDLLLAHGADINARFYPLNVFKHWDDIEISHTYSMLEFGEKLQRSQHRHSIVRSGVMARLRDHLGLPVDAMLPVNATTLYQQLRKSR